MKIGSLFSGIGGLELGLERAGFGPVIWQAEQDPFCLQVLQKHWPDAKRYTDVRQIDSNAQQPEIICGGFPCQDISFAGKGLGLRGERSGLWFEFARIIRELRPRFVIVENVPALLGRGLGAVLGDLASSGYDAQWDCIPAQAVGAPHRRDRLFIAAWRMGDAESLHSDASEHYAGGGNKSARACQEIPEPRSSCGASFEWPPAPGDMRSWGRLPASSQPAICRMSYGVPSRVDRLRSLGNAVVPQVAEIVGGWIWEAL